MPSALAPFTPQLSDRTSHGRSLGCDSSMDLAVVAGAWLDGIPSLSLAFSLDVGVSLFLSFGGLIGSAYGSLLLGFLLILTLSPI